MKTILPFSILFFSFAIRATCQITITQSDMPHPGDTLRVSVTDDTAGLPTPALTGQGITWDYSALTAQSQTIDTFLNVSSTPLPYQLYFNDAILYPNYKATVAQKGTPPKLVVVTLTQWVNYYKDGASNYENVGFGANINGLPTPVKDNNIDVIYKFPMNYGNADSCHSNNSVSIPSLGYYSQKQYRINHVEGWGTLITPFGTFSALKVKTILYPVDSFYLDTLHIGFATPPTEQIEYKWLANGEHIPVLEIDETQGSPARQYTYLDSARKVVSGITSLDAPSKSITVYPNPGSGRFVLSCHSESGVADEESGVILNVYNVLGQPVLTKTLRSAQGDNTIDLSSQPAGVYLYRVLDATGSLIGQGKLVIQR